MPEMAFLLLLCMFGGLIYFVGNDNTRLPVSSATINGYSYPFWAIGVATILLSISLSFYMITLRIIQRSTDKVRSVAHYYMGCHACSEYYFFLLFSYVFLICLGLYLYFKVNASIIWASCVFLPLFYQLFVIFYTNWAENDYLILGDHEDYNKKVGRKKKKI